MNLGNLQKLIGAIQLESGNTNIKKIILSPWDYYDTPQSLKEALGKMGIQLMPDVGTSNGIVRVVHPEERERRQHGKGNK